MAIRARGDQALRRASATRQLDLHSHAAARPPQPRGSSTSSATRQLDLLSPAAARPSQPRGSSTSVSPWTLPLQRCCAAGAGCTTPKGRRGLGHAE
eukprot:366364-Chlamydomonas_euryale.AAC.1